MEHRIKSARELVVDVRLIVCHGITARIVTILSRSTRYYGNIHAYEKNE